MIHVLSRLPAAVAAQPVLALVLIAVVVIVVVGISPTCPALPAAAENVTHLIIFRSPRMCGIGAPPHLRPARAGDRAGRPPGPRDRPVAAQGRAAVSAHKLLALLWDDVDLGSRQLHVRRALQRVGSKLQMVEPKTGSSVRTVVLPKIAVRYLREHKKRQNGERLALGDAWREHGLVFASSVGTPIEPRNVNRRWDELRAKAGLDWLRLHDLRHGCASFLQVSGVASGASFGGSRERALPAVQRVALPCRRAAGPPRGCGDLGLHGPPVSDATMMRLMPLRRVHHCCACWQHDTSGSTRLHRMHHPAVPVSGARPAPPLRGARRATGSLILSRA